MKNHEQVYPQQTWSLSKWVGQTRVNLLDTQLILLIIGMVCVVAYILFLIKLILEI
jgi:hypothetical protein